jgi:hypothetical protein
MKLAALTKLAKVIVACAIGVAVLVPQLFTEQNYESIS